MVSILSRVTIKLSLKFDDKRRNYAIMEARGKNKQSGLVCPGSIACRKFMSSHQTLGLTMNFAETLVILRQKSGRSRYRLAQYCGISEPYILRLESGERANPSRDVVLILGLALQKGSEDMDIWDIDVLLLSAGYAPLRRRGNTGTAFA